MVVTFSLNFKIYYIFLMEFVHKWFSKNRSSICKVDMYTRRELLVFKGNLLSFLIWNWFIFTRVFLDISFNMHQFLTVNFLNNGIYSKTCLLDMRGRSVTFRDFFYGILSVATFVINRIGVLICSCRALSWDQSHSLAFWAY